MWLTPDTPDGAIVGRVLLIPEVFTPYVDGALEDLADAFNWEAFGTETPDAAALAMRAMIDDFYASTVMTDISGGLTSIPIWNPSSAPNGWAFGADALAFDAGSYAFSNTNQNNEVTWAVPIGAGTWSISALVTQRTTSGIITWSIDGTSVGTTDTRAGATVRNAIVTVTGIVVTIGGSKLLRAKMLTSSGAQFGLSLQALAIHQTA